MAAGKAGEQTRQHEGRYQNGSERVTHDTEQVGGELFRGAVVGPEYG